MMLCSMVEVLVFMVVIMIRLCSCLSRLLMK